MTRYSGGTFRIDNIATTRPSAPTTGEWRKLPAVILANALTSELPAVVVCGFNYLHIGIASDGNDLLQYVALREDADQLVAAQNGWGADAIQTQSVSNGSDTSLLFLLFLHEVRFLPASPS